MDRYGAKLVSSTQNDYDDYGAVAPPRKYIFDKPFFLALWKDGAELPYLAIWVNSADILVGAKNKRKKRVR